MKNLREFGELSDLLAFRSLSSYNFELDGNGKEMENVCVSHVQSAGCSVPSPL